MINNRLPFLLITISAVILLVCPALISNGMFMDGLIYATVSKNLAHGQGTFWFPAFTETIYSPFHEHPPLVFGIESLFFRVLGDSMYTERIFSFLTLVINFILLMLLWREVSRDNPDLKRISFLPVLMFLITPVVFWSFGNNMIENTLMIFTSTSVLFILRGMTCKKYSLLWLFSASLMLVAGFFCKGFIALFPLSVVFFYRIIFRRFSFFKMAAYTLFITISTGLIFFLIMLHGPAFESLKAYLHTQVAASLTGEFDNSRLFIIRKLFQELLPALSIMLIAVVTGFFLKIRFIGKEKKQWVFFALAIALSASFPIIVSPKQMGFYLLPSLPFYCFAAGLLISGVAVKLVDAFSPRTNRFKILLIVSVTALIFSIIFSLFQIGETGRDREKLQDIESIAETIGEPVIISIAPSLYKDWSLIAYFNRYYSISTDRVNLQTYHLVEKDRPEQVPEGYTDKGIPLKKYRLYTKITSELSAP